MEKKVIYIVLVLLTGLSVIISCNDNSPGQQFIPGGDNSIVKLSCKGIIISESQYNLAETNEFIVNDSYIEGDSLLIELQYGGGCGPVSAELYTDGLFMESNPVQLNVILTFTDDDPCEMLLKKKFCFDLSNLATYYNDSYQTTEGTIILNIKDYNSLTYNF